MELLTGKPLSTILAKGARLSSRKLAQIILPVISAVAAAHARGIVHRDLKPENIFRVYEGDRRDVRVLDFGIAKLGEHAIGDETAVRTADGFALGTLEYMAPEQLMRGRRPDHRVDIWSLGVIAFECLAGSRPFRANDPIEFVRAIRQGVPLLRRIAPSVPADLAALVERMLSVDPDFRPKLREVYAALVPHLERHAPPLPPTRAALFPRARFIRLATAIAVPATLFIAGFALGRCSVDDTDAETESAPPKKKHKQTPRQPEALAAIAID